MILGKSWWNNLKWVHFPNVRISLPQFTIFSKQQKSRCLSNIFFKLLRQVILICTYNKYPIPRSIIVKVKLYKISLEFVCLTAAVIIPSQVQNDLTLSKSMEFVFVQYAAQNKN